MKFTKPQYFRFTDRSEKLNSFKCFKEKKVEGEFKNEKNLIFTLQK